MNKARELKRLKRTGWVLKNVAAPESVADHSFMLAVMSYLYAKKLNLNADRCVKMALVHDLGEAFSGDIPDRINDRDRTMPREEKRKREAAGMRKTLSRLPLAQAKEMRGLWKEFVARKTKEAQLVKDLDKLEMCMQALEYARKDKNKKKFAEFFEDGEQNIATPEIRAAFSKVRADFKHISEKNRDAI
ncbi:MAG: HD domain-containing protein [Candidatus Aenigmarchaeota archaeon]|nr:HD domain-containing protein [Candidatus Aenigmarchaeota archaeon]